MARGCCAGLAFGLALFTVGNGKAVGELRPDEGPPIGVIGPNGVPGREIDAGWAGGKALAPGKDLEIGPTVWSGVADSDGRAAGG
ncbi:hypothetical protein RAB80_014671 [Fusarium oxysporum f. sp. vasinfectum]|nr:hypothetical protein RAB80_014671 [Fusarium oxysporum f. sp. vasinfectum]KAK2926525.1 hypothetical protein FoTM2_013393 [Fusarium oxysporum f. sp. vasinfectum]